MSQIIIDGLVDPIYARLPRYFLYGFEPRLTISTVSQPIPHLDILKQMFDRNIHMHEVSKLS